MLFKRAIALITAIISVLFVVSLGGCFGGDGETESVRNGSRESGEIVESESEKDEALETSEISEETEELNDTMGVIYDYDEDKDCYYVRGEQANSELNVEELTILAKYDDGTHGVKAVTYIAEKAFMGNKALRKVILPESIASLDGCVFQWCKNLEYVSMIGIRNLDYNGKSLGFGVRRGNNFMDCTALKSVILNPRFVTNCQQFFLNGGEPKKPILDIYVYAASGMPEFGVGTNTNLLTGDIYYYSETERSGSWRYLDGVATLW